MTRIAGIRYTSPVPFTRKQRFLLKTIPPFAGVLAKGWFRTCTVSEQGREHLEAVLSGVGRAIIGFWHEYLGLALHVYRNTGNHTLTSYSYDGELAARLVEQFGLHAVRGSSSRGGADALAGLTMALQYVPMVGITLDGPRGPRRATKPGAAILAVRTRTPIVPHAFYVSSAWRLKSWDRFLIPKAFSTIYSVYGSPIYPPEDSSRSGLKIMNDRLQTAMMALHADLESKLTASFSPPAQA